MPTYIIHYNSGDSHGPFNIFLSGSYGLSPYASNVTRQQLEGGYSVVVPSNVNSSSVEVFDMSVGCTGFEILPFPSPSPSTTPSISISPSITPSISISPSITPSLTTTPSITPSVTPPPSISPSATPSITPSSTPGVSPSPTPSISISRTPSATPPPPPSTLWLGRGEQFPTQDYLACNVKNISTAYYTLYNYISVTDVIFTDPGLTVPLTAVTNNGWLALNYYGVSYSWVVVRLNSSGVVQEISSNSCTS